MFSLCHVYSIFRFYHFEVKRFTAIIRISTNQTVFFTLRTNFNTKYIRSVFIRIHVSNTFRMVENRHVFRILLTHRVSGLPFGSFTRTIKKSNLFMIRILFPQIFSEFITFFHVYSLHRRVVCFLFTVHTCSRVSVYTIIVQNLDTFKYNCFPSFRFHSA